ncbi:MAG: CHAT domain-containing protein [Anaerolineales bacterium]|nr:CHAT domain-containing protein [Anaerolineales bacterium]
MTNPRHYIDFKLYLTRTAEGACQVSVLPTPEVGESILPVVVSQPLDEDLRLFLAEKVPTLADLIQLGRQLADHLLPEGDIREMFAAVFKRVKADKEADMGVRLRLIIADHELKTWPWEYVYFDPQNGPPSLAGFLALDGRVSIIRHEPLNFPHPQVTPQDPTADIQNLRMVLVSAMPDNAPVLELDRELTNIKQALDNFNVDGVSLAVQEIKDATVRDLMRLEKGTYIFHFAGHGKDEVKEDQALADGTVKHEGTLLLLAEGTRKASHYRARQLAKDLDYAGVRLAVLGACQSGTRTARYPWDSVAGALTAEGIPAVLAMQYEVEDKAAIAFNEAFYTALAAGLSLDEALFLGRRATIVDLTSDPRPDAAVPLEWGVPVLYSRLPDGRLFPERIQRAGEAAEKIRKVINQSVDLVDTDGKVVGVRAGLVKSGFQLNQTLGTVKGQVTGAIIGTVGEEATLEVNQEADTVSGDLTGAVFDEL